MSVLKSKNIELFIAFLMILVGGLSFEFLVDWIKAHTSQSERVIYLVTGVIIFMMCVSFYQYHLIKIKKRFEEGFEFGKNEGFYLGVKSANDQYEEGFSDGYNKGINFLNE